MSDSETANGSSTGITGEGASEAGDSLLIVIVAYRSADRLPICLDSIRLHCPESHIVVVDNSSEPKTRSVVEGFGDLDVRLVDPARNLGYAGGVELGLAGSAPTDLVLILNPDTRLTADPRDIASTLVDFNIVSGLLVSGDSPPSRAPNARPRATLSRELLRAVIGTKAYRGPVVQPGMMKVDQLDGAYLLMRREWYEQHPLDTRFELYYEDVELCDRARRELGCGLWTQSSAVHEGGASSDRAKPTSYKVLRVSRARYLRMRYPHTPWWILFSPFPVEALVRTVVRVPDPPRIRLASAKLALAELRHPGAVRVFDAG